MTWLARKGMMRQMASSGALLHRSTFTAADGTALSAYTPDVGTGWAPGAAVITGGYAAFSTGSVVMDTVDVSQANVRLVGTVRFASGTREAGIIGRYENTQNFILALADLNSFLLYEIIGNVFTLRNSLSLTLAAGVDHTIEMTMDGASVTASINGSAELSYTTSVFLASTLHGLWLDVNTGCKADIFEVYSL